MLKKTLVSAIAMAAMASVSLADVNLVYNPSTINVDEATEVAIELMSNPGNDVSVGGIGFDYDTGSDAWNALNPSDFGWTPAIMQDPNQWFITEDLPNPQAVAFFPGAAVPVPDGTAVEFARMTMTPNALGDWSLASNAIVADENAGPLSVKGGDPATITVVPEPASLGLLAMGALAMIRRRR